MELVKAVVGESSPWTSGAVPPQPSPAADAWTAPLTPNASIASATTATPTVLPLTSPAAAGPGASVDPVAVLDELADRVTGVAGAILASVDGFGLARSSSMDDEPAHAAMLAAAVGLAHQLASMGGGERLRQLVVDHDAGLMLVWPIGAQRVLAVLATSHVDQRALRIAVHAHVSTLSGGTA